MTLTPFEIQVIGAIRPILYVEVTAAIGAAGAYAAKHVHGKLARQALTQGEALMQALVTAENQAVVNPLKAAGTWTAADGQATKLRVIQAWKDEATKALSQTLAKGRADLDGLLGTWLENAVSTAPNRTTALPPKPVANADAAATS